MIVTSSTSCQSRYVPGDVDSGAAIAAAEMKVAAKLAKMLKDFRFMPGCCPSNEIRTSAMDRTYTTYVTYRAARYAIAPKARPRP